MCHPPEWADARHRTGSPAIIPPPSRPGNGQGNLKTDRCPAVAGRYPRTLRNPAPDQAHAAPIAIRPGGRFSTRLGRCSSGCSEVESMGQEPKTIGVSMGLPGGRGKATSRTADGQDDCRGPLRLADRSCCCPATPLVSVLIPPTSERPHPVDLLLCGHHYVASRDALASVGAMAMDEPGTVLESATAGKTLVLGNHDRLRRGRPWPRLWATAEPNQSLEFWRSWLWASVLFVILAALPYSVTIGGTGPCAVRACAQPVAQHPHVDRPKCIATVARCSKNASASSRSPDRVRAKP